jgi:plastocyanin
MKTEVYVIGKDGGMANVFVWIKKGLEGKKYDPPKDAVELDQVGCRYTPHVLGVMVGQTLKIKNSDDTMHNVHALSSANPEFNFGQAKKGAEADKVFTSAEFFRIKCDVHGWMSAWVGVMPHPFYVVTGEAGTFELKDLPAGEYEVEAWHEKLGTLQQVAKVGEKESKEISFTFKAPQK